MLSTVSVRFPPVAAELAMVPRTNASRPLRHSPEDTSWSLSAVKSAATAFASESLREASYFFTTSRIAASPVPAEADWPDENRAFNKRSDNTNQRRIAPPPFAGRQSTTIVGLPFWRCRSWPGARVGGV
jgi:hypothetical protein